MRGQWHDVVADHVGEEWSVVLGVIPGLHLTSSTECPVKQLADAVDLWGIHRLVAVNVDQLHMCIWDLVDRIHNLQSAFSQRDVMSGVYLCCVSEEALLECTFQQLALDYCSHSVTHRSSVMWCKEVIGEVEVELLSELG